jgi:hypothetical protein
LDFAQGKLAGISWFSQRDRPASGANDCFAPLAGCSFTLNATSIKLLYHSADG